MQSHTIFNSHNNSYNHANKNVDMSYTHKVLGQTAKSCLRSGVAQDKQPPLNTADYHSPTAEVGVTGPGTMETGTVTVGVDVEVANLSDISLLHL